MILKQTEQKCNENNIKQAKNYTEAKNRFVNFYYKYISGFYCISCVWKGACCLYDFFGGLHLAGGFPTESKTVYKS